MARIAAGMDFGPHEERLPYSAYQGVESYACRFATSKKTLLRPALSQTADID